MDNDSEQTTGQSIEGVGQEMESASTSIFLEKTWKDDFVLIVEGRKLYVSKTLLAYASPVLDRMFRSDFKEKDQEEMKLPGKKFDDVLEFLHCICPGKQTDICEENVYRVLPLAEEYQVEHVKSKCEAHLISKLKDELKADEVYDMLQLASTYNMDDLRTKCIIEASKRSVQHLDKALKRIEVPMKTICIIQDKMIRRLGKSEQENRSLQAVNKYLILGLNTVERIKLMNCETWEGISLDLALNTTIRQAAHNNTQTKEFEIIETDAKVTVKRSGYAGNLSLELSLDANKVKNCVISVFGRFMIKNYTKKNPDVTENIQMLFKDGQFKKVMDTNTGKLLDAEGGFINDCTGMIDTEVFIIAGKQVIQ